MQEAYHNTKVFVDRGQRNSISLCFSHNFCLASRVLIVHHRTSDGMAECRPAKRKELRKRGGPTSSRVTSSYTVACLRVFGRTRRALVAGGSSDKRVLSCTACVLLLKVDWVFESIAALITGLQLFAAHSVYLRSHAHNCKCCTERVRPPQRA